MGWLVAIAASTLGILWSFYSDYPTGPAVVVMLAILLVASSIVYYVKYAPVKLRAVAAVAGIAVSVGAGVLGGMHDANTNADARIIQIFKLPAII